MKLYELLKESDNFSEAASQLKKAKNAISAALAGHVLYRGAHIDEYAKEVGKLPCGYTLYYVTERKEKRDSMTGTNFFRDIVDESPAWKNVPSRSMSTFASVHAPTVAVFGPVQIVLPLDSVKTFAEMPHDFNIFRFKIKGEREISTGNFTTDISSLTTRALSMFESIQFILQQPTLQKLKSSKSNSLWHKIRKAAEMVETQADFDKIKGELSNSELYKVLKHNVADHFLNVKKHIINQKKIDAVANIAKAAIKTQSDASPLLKRFLEALDYEISLFYGSEYFLSMIGAFSGSLTNALKKEFTPEKMNVSVHSSVESAVKNANNQAEVWFEGPYFIISGGSSTYGDGTSKNKPNPQKYFKQDEVREFFENI